MKLTRFGISLIIANAFLAAVFFFSSTPRAFASSPATEVTDRSDDQIQAELNRQFNTNRFKDVQASVHEGVIALKGTVELFADKEKAEMKALRGKKAIAVRNEIHVMDARISDKELQEKLAKKLEYDRVGYGTTTFNAISVGVRDGVVMLGGRAYGPSDKSSALAAVGYTPGVQDVIDNIEVDPVSPMDDKIRLNVARLVYGSPSLFKYSIDPGRPIRISVQNGNVTLFGAVDSEADRDMANIRANGAEGVFSVKNELQVGAANYERD
jgi:hyperosmotically inducible protein